MLLPARQVVSEILLLKPVYPTNPKPLKKFSVQRNDHAGISGAVWGFKL